MPVCPPQVGPDGDHPSEAPWLWEGEDAMSEEERIGYRIEGLRNRVSQEVYGRLLEASSGNVCDAMGRFGAMDYRIKPVDPAMKCVGTAITVKSRPCDNLIVYKALDMAQAGDVIVIGTGRFTGASVWGDLTSLIAREKRLSGMVTDGLVRDTAGIKDVGIPVFASGSIPSSPFKDGPGEINVPISCGGVTVEPGDIIFGDVDGVLVIPQGGVKEIASQALAIAAKEASKTEEILSGKLIPDWVNDKLKDLGYVL
jgi:regulator of RNase E activity RraA